LDLGFRPRDADIYEFARTYDVSLDGERFLVIREVGTSERELILVMNWSEELKRLVPPGGLR